MHPLSADFGESIHLLGYDLDASAIRSSNALTITLEWHVRAPVNADYSLFIHVLNDMAERVAQIDVPLDTGRWPSRLWRPGRCFSTLYRVPLPPDLPAGTYRLAMGIYDPHTFARLPLRTDGERAADAGEHALLLTRITIP